MIEALVTISLVANLVLVLLLVSCYRAYAYQLTETLARERVAAALSKELDRAAMTIMTLQQSIVKPPRKRTAFDV